MISKAERSVKNQKTSLPVWQLADHPPKTPLPRQLCWQMTATDPEMDCRQNIHNYH